VFPSGARAVSMRAPTRFEAIDAGLSPSSRIK
jgi:hypothetical protein